MAASNWTNQIQNQSGQKSPPSSIRTKIARKTNTWGRIIWRYKRQHVSYCSWSLLRCVWAIGQMSILIVGLLVTHKDLPPWEISRVLHLNGAQYSFSICKISVSFFHDSTSVRVHGKDPVEMMKMRLVKQNVQCEFRQKLWFLRFSSDRDDCLLLRRAYTAETSARWPCLGWNQDQVLQFCWYLSLCHRGYVTAEVYLFVWLWIKPLKRLWTAFNEHFRKCL